MQLHTVNPDDRLPSIFALEIWVDYKPQPDGSYVEEERIKWVRKGANGAETSEAVKRLQKDNGPIWQALKPAYDAWKQGKSAPVNGVPLEAWPGATKQMVKVLESFHVRTVEDLAGLDDGAMARVQVPGIRSIRQNARAFIEAQKSTSHIAGKLSELESERDNLRREVDELKDLVKSLAAKEGVEVTDTPKRGRPRKEAA
jgi:hypothetical protein